MGISAKQVKELREQTGAGFMECKSALQQAQGDLASAVDILRKRGLAAAKKKTGRAAAEGAVGSYIHAGGKIGVLVEVNCETDFVAKTKGFLALVKDIAMHVAASSPQFVGRAEVGPDVLAKEREIYREQALAAGKPEKVVDRIVDGKMERFYQEICLLEQPFVKDLERTVQDVIHEAVAKMGENIRIRRFVRFGLGEGLEKRQDDFAAEVKAQAGTEAS
jgi:elongation factor Ts